jgi:hypothetical protein
MPTNRTFVQRPARGALTDAQELELWLGPGHHGSAFGSRDDLQAAWSKHREKLMTLWAKGGKRPAAWWEFEAPFPRPFEHEASALYAADLLGEQERAELVSRWRREFERAHRPNFFFCEGPERIFRGAPARRRHYRWADIPRSLRLRWTRERRRRRRTIRELEETTSPEPAPAA